MKSQYRYMKNYLSASGTLNSTKTIVTSVASRILSAGRTRARKSFGSIVGNRMSRMTSSNTDRRYSRVSGTFCRLTSALPQLKDKHSKVWFIPYLKKSSGLLPARFSFLLTWAPHRINGLQWSLEDHLDIESQQALQWSVSGNPLNWWFCCRC